jgi:uncharacterized cupredoxin-like copper-binding protein
VTMKRRALAALGILVAAVPACGGGASERALQVRMRYSRYLPAAIHVNAGQTVDFALVNADPIEHEFVIGTAAEQLAHERGDPHDPHTAPGQALLPPNETVHLRYTFRDAGALLYACHRPGHYAYGMRGTITVKG